jgi:hypothetical protein
MQERVVAFTGKRLPFPGRKEEKMREIVLAFSGNGEELSEYLSNLCSYFGKDATLADLKWYIEND